MGAKSGTNMLYITTITYGVLCKGNGWASNTRDYSMAKSLGIKYPPFATWFLNIIRVQTINGVDVYPIVIHSSNPPNLIANMYKNMWAYGNHY
jgi:hypothetical protein